MREGGKSSINIKHRYFLRSSEVKSLLKEASKLYPQLLNKLSLKAKVEVVKTNGEASVYLLDKVPILLRINNKLLPTFQAIKEIPLDSVAKVMVDEGAVPHILNGAHVMAPGIRRIEGSMAPGSIVLVENEKHTPIAIGIGLMDKGEVLTRRKGKAVANLHYVGDPLWQLLKSLS